MPGLLRIERAHRLKCFHGSSGAKDWMIAAAARGLFREGAPRLGATPIRPFTAIGPAEFERGERRKASYHAVLRTLRLRDPLRPGARA